MSNSLAEHITVPRNRGRLLNPTGFCVHLDPPSGDALRIQVRVVQGRLAEVGFLCFGDPVITGVASFVTEAVRGQSVEVLADLSVEMVVQALGLLPNKVHCAEFVLLTLLEAVQDHHRRRRLGREVGS